MDCRMCHLIQRQREEPLEPFMKFFTKLFAAAAVTAAAAEITEIALNVPCTDQSPFGAKA